jgi:hypothetical protein
MIIQIPENVLVRIVDFHQFHLDITEVESYRVKGGATKELLQVAENIPDLYTYLQSFKFSIKNWLTGKYRKGPYISIGYKKYCNKGFTVYSVYCSDKLAFASYNASDIFMYYLQFDNTEDATMFFLENDIKL